MSRRVQTRKPARTWQRWVLRWACSLPDTVKRKGPLQALKAATNYELFKVARRVPGFVHDEHCPACRPRVRPTTEAFIYAAFKRWRDQGSKRVS